MSFSLHLSNDVEILSKRTVQLNAQATDKIDAVKQAGELLVQAGYVAQEYIEGMLTRESITSTYLGNGVAIPHGQFKDRAIIYHTGLSVVQLPAGVQWSPNETVHLVIGIAAASDDHIGVLANLAEVLEDPETAEQLACTTDPTVIIERLNRKQDTDDV